MRPWQLQPSANAWRCPILPSQYQKALISLVILITPREWQVSAPGGTRRPAVLDVSRVGCEEGGLVDCLPILVLHCGCCA